jgi:hypothetical protein
MPRRLRPNARVLFARALTAFNGVRAEQAALGPGNPIEAEYKQALYRMARAIGASPAKCSKAMCGGARDYEPAFDKLLGKELADEVKARYGDSKALCIPTDGGCRAMVLEARG